MAEVERAMRSVGWGCVVFIIGLVLAAVGVAVLGHFFFDFVLLFRPVK